MMDADRGQDGAFSTAEFHEQLLALLPKLRAHAMLMTRNRSQAEDLVQDTAHRALRAWRSFTPGTDMGAWTYRIMRNQFISSARRWRAAAGPDLEAVQPALPANQEDAVILGELRAGLSKLLPGYREALLLVGGHGLSYEEAAARCDCSVGTMKSRVCRARRAMRKYLDDAHNTAGIVRDDDGDVQADETGAVAGRGRRGGTGRRERVAASLDPAVRELTSPAMVSRLLGL